MIRLIYTPPKGHNSVKACRAAARLAKEHRTLVFFRIRGTPVVAYPYEKAPDIFCRFVTTREREQVMQ